MTHAMDPHPADEAILAAIGEMQAHDLPTHGGHTLAYVYDSGVPGLDELAAAAHAMAMDANALDPTAFPSISAMEGDLVASAAALVGGGPETVGTVTSGGTESCMLAVSAARDGAPAVEHPRMAMPTSAHASFHKAAHYFGVAIDLVDVDSVTLRADPRAIKDAIGADTVLVVASAPSYAHGVIDPIADIAAIAADAGVRCHVDACIGGWILGCWKRWGLRGGDDAVPAFGFDVPGVTSLSVDLHKYAYAPKGTSVLLHARADLRASQFFVSAAWPGYAMLNTTLQSTRSGGPIAAAWAVVSRLGGRAIAGRGSGTDDVEPSGAELDGQGYRDIAERTAAAVDEIRVGIDTIDGLGVLVEPDATLIAVTASADGPNVFTVADEMLERGYYIQPQFTYGNVPATLHMTITAANYGREAELVGALRESVAAAHEAEEPGYPPEVIEQVMAADLSSTEGLAAAAAALGLIGENGELALPKRMASINALLDALPIQARELVLRGVLSMLIRPGQDLLA